MASEQIRRLLIAEDETTLSYFLAQSFLNEAEDYEVVAVGSAEEALEALAERERAGGSSRFAVIIADIVLPHMSGLDLLERVHSTYPEARVILITAYGTEHIRERAAALGAFAYIEKPFPFPTMKETVFRALAAGAAEGPAAIAEPQRQP